MRKRLAHGHKNLYGRDYDSPLPDSPVYDRIIYERDPLVRRLILATSRSTALMSPFNQMARA